MTLYYHINEVQPYINWMYFRHAWGLPMHPLTCTCCSSDWQKLYKDAIKILKQWDIEGRTTKFRIELYSANSKGEDIILHSRIENRKREIEDSSNLSLTLTREEAGCGIIPVLRQQHAPYLCLADFVRPEGTGEDTIGLFASTVDSELVKSDELDEYQRLLSQTLADRLAEATAEKGHEEVRKHIWGYAPDESLTPEEMFHEKYQGKRPAVGYPSLPDQSLNFILAELLDFPSLGISLTESGAMRPHASTSGLLLSHPQTCHFSVGKIGEDQLKNYALRRGMTSEGIRKFISL